MTTRQPRPFVTPKFLVSRSVAHQWLPERPRPSLRDAATPINPKPKIAGTGAAQPANRKPKK